MNKFVKFCRKPLFIISICLILVFTAVMVFFPMIVKRGSTYSYGISLMGYSLETEVKLIDDTNAKVSLFENNVLNSETSYTYEIRDNILYLTPSSGTEEEFGKIGTYEIIATEDGFSISLNCKETFFVKVISIVVLVFAGIGFILSLVLLLAVKDKKTEQNSKYKVCQYCGEQLENSDCFCSKCGSKL